MNIAPLVSIGAAVVVAVTQSLMRRSETAAPEPAAPLPAADTTLVDAVTVARDETKPADVRLSAGLAAVAVAQARPARESPRKTYIWPLVIVVVGLFGPVVDHVADAIDPKPVDCAAYLEGVRALPSLAPDPTRLAAVAAAIDPSHDEVRHCGGTPTDILRRAGRIP